MSGYSSTPLAGKVGLTKASFLCVLHAPENYKQLLPYYYRNMATSLENEYDWMHAFYTDSNELEKEFPRLKEHLSSAGQLWISWPKKASKIETDLNENIIRGIGLANGLVDVKVAAIDNRWSGLKFVYRLKDR